MRLGQPAILAGGLHGGGGLDGFAEGLHRDPRRRRDVLVDAGVLVDAALRRGGLQCVCDHLPTSLILPLSALG